MKSESNGIRLGEEISFYESDPDHCRLNEYICKINDPVKRQEMIELINEVADVEGILEEIRQKTMTRL
jgi:hypothetical protein